VMAMVVEEGTDPVLARILRPTPTNEPGATSGDDGDADSGV
jgi:hypothetical protein